MTNTPLTSNTQDFFNSLMAGDVLNARAHMRQSDVDTSELRNLCANVNVFEVFASKSLEHLTLWRDSKTPDEAYSPVYRLEVLEFILEHHLARVSVDVFLQNVLRGIDPDFDEASPLEEQTVVRLLERAFEQHLYGIAAPTEQHLIEAYQLMTWGYPIDVLPHALQWGWFDFMFHDVVADDLYNTLIQDRWQLKDFLPKSVIEAMPWGGGSSIPGVFNTYKRVMDVRPELFDWSDAQRNTIFKGVCNMIVNQWATDVAEKLLAFAHENADDTVVFIERINTMRLSNQKISAQNGGALLAILNQRPGLLAERVVNAPEGQEWTVYDLLIQGELFFKPWGNPDSTYVQACIDSIERLESARQQKVLTEQLANVGMRSKTARI